MTAGAMMVAIAMWVAGFGCGWLARYVFTGAFSQDEIDAINLMRRGTHHLAKYPGGQKKAGLPRKRAANGKQAGEEKAGV